VVSSREETGRRLVMAGTVLGGFETRILVRFIARASGKFGKCWQIFAGLGITPSAGGGCSYFARRCVTLRHCLEGCGGRSGLASDSPGRYHDEPLATVLERVCGALPGVEPVRVITHVAQPGDDFGSPSLVSLGQRGKAFSMRCNSVCPFPNVTPLAAPSEHRCRLTWVKEFAVIVHSSATSP